MSHPTYTEWLDKYIQLYDFFLYFIKQFFSKQQLSSYCCNGCTTWTLIKRIEKKLDGNCKGCYGLYKTNPGSNISKSNSCMTTYHSSRRPSKLDEQIMQDTAGETRTNSLGTFSHGPRLTDAQV